MSDESFKDENLMFKLTTGHFNISKYLFDKTECYRYFDLSKKYFDISKYIETVF